MLKETVKRLSVVFTILITLSFAFILITYFELPVQEDTTLEEQITRSITYQYREYSDGTGGFVEHSSSNESMIPDWNTQLCALETLELVNNGMTGLNASQNRAIANWVFNRRQINTEGIPEWWWGVEHAIDALKILELTSYLNQTITEGVKSKVIAVLEEVGVTWDTSDPDFSYTLELIVKPAISGWYDITNLYPPERAREI